jgi:hypothetical protein
MGCQGEVTLGDNLTFSICTHDPDTGVLTDADAVPSYRVYEDETAVAIASGVMAKLDDANTTGFYSELLACTTLAGYEIGKSYNVYIQATVDGDTGGISYSFTVRDVKALMVAALDTDTYAELAAVPAATSSLTDKINWLFMLARNKVLQTALQQTLRDDADGADVSTAAVSDDTVTFTRSEWV